MRNFEWVIKESTLNKFEYRELGFCMCSDLCLFSSLKTIDSIFDVLSK